MGANAGTAVPVYASGQVLDAARLNLTNCGVPVFAGTANRDAAFGGSGEKTLAEGQLAYLEDANVVQYYDGAAWATVGPAAASPLVYITKATFSAVASVSMPAGTFTSTYKNYKVFLKVDTTSAHQTLGVRVNVAGSAQTGSTYLGGWVQINNSGTLSQIGSNSATSAVATYLHSTIGAVLDLTVFDPVDSGTPTSWSGTGRGAASDNNTAGCSGGNFQNANQANDGLTFVVGGTFGGTYYVYGIKDS
jgi:hypothetical protein